ncbi:hypothetical protein BBJ28_00001796 [Nothophytophthora sp. Chile5]|nr:hypothetical protein BBJ28_00001796 [Nothophytophthora sp. Chile5]
MSLSTDGSDVEPVEIAVHDDDDTFAAIDDSEANSSSQLAASAIRIARKCVRTEDYEEAVVPLQNVLATADPASISYKQVALHVAQLLKAASLQEASIECMLARLYEQLEGRGLAQFWWEKLSTSRSSASRGGSSARPDLEFWEAVADRAFEQELYVFAADFYAQALGAERQKRLSPSTRFIHRYLVALQEFVGPQGPAAHTNSCRSIAWALAQPFRRRRGSTTPGRSDCYRDEHFYQMRAVCASSFPEIYHVVFAWVDGPAGRIARWWRRRRAANRHPFQEDETNGKPVPAASSKCYPTGRVKKKPKPTQVPAAPIARGRQPRSHVLTTGCGKTAAPVSLSPSPKRKPAKLFHKKPRGLPAHDTSPEAASRAKGSGETTRGPVSVGSGSKAASTPTPTASTSNNNNVTTDDCRPEPVQSLSGRRSSVAGFRRAAKKRGEHYEDSPTKQKLNIVRRLRAKQLDGDLLDVRPSSAATDTNTDEEKLARASSTSLLDVYPLQLPSTENFMASCGRLPGFADLDLTEVEQFARLAHYRARVLMGTHLRMESLDAARVKPQWLQDLERAVALVENQQQRNLTGGKVLIEDDSAAHLAEVHARLVLQLTALRRQYARDFGETSFTRQLRALTRRLVEWKFSRISELLGALDGVKTAAAHEEKQRNLEFFHVHEGGEVTKPRRNSDLGDDGG